MQYMSELFGWFSTWYYRISEERRSLNCTVACLSLISATPAFQVLHLHLLQRATSQGLATRYFQPSLTQRQVDKSYCDKTKLVWQTIMLGNIRKANGVGVKSSIWRKKHSFLDHAKLTSSNTGYKLHKTGTISDLANLMVVDWQPLLSSWGFNAGFENPKPCTVSR
jgi:hypothetical protein